MRFATVLSLAALLLAGCADGGGSEDRQTTSLAAGGAAPVEAPNWTVGDWWRYDGSFGLESFTADRIVTEDAGGDWIVDTASAETAWNHVLEPISVLGPVSKEDLAGSQEEGRVRFWDFPLEHNKTWQTAWDGQSFSARAVRQGDAVFLVEYRQDGEVARETVYDAQARWFTRMTIHDLDGEPFEMTLAESGSDYGGEYVRWLVHDETQAAISGGVGSAGFGVPEAATDLWHRFEVACGQGAYTYAVRPVEDPAAGTGDAQPCPAEDRRETAIDAVPGEWQAAVSVADGSISVQVYVRELQTLTL